MATCGAFQTQLSSILEVLVRAAVAEISKLVDDKCAFLHLEISQKQSENEMLKRKLMVMESRNAQLQQGYDNYLERGNSCSSAAEVKFPDVHEGTAASFSIKEESPDEPLWITDSAQTNGSSVQYQNTASSESQAFDKNCQMDPNAVNQSKTIDFSRTYSSSHNTSSNMTPNFTIKTEKDEPQSRFTQDNCQHGTVKPTQPASNNSDFCLDEQDSHLWSAIIDENDIESGFPEFSSVVDEFSNAFSETDVAAKSNSVQQAQSQRPCNRIYNNEYPKNSSQPDNFHIPILEDDQSSQSSSSVYPPNSGSNSHHHHHHHFQSQHKAFSGPMRSYVCMQCGKTFGRLHQFKLHQQSHKRKRAFWCAFCGKSFQCSSHLSIHHRTHTGEKPFVCGQCGKRFTQQSSLRVHQRTHSGERPYSCSQCGKSFILMHHLKRHRVIHTYSG